jgi:ribosome-associated toxin RatA of RatAB toxin-antitoxin module
MAKAALERNIPVPIDALWKVITDYAAYPKFLDGVKNVQVRSESAETKHVWYQVSMVKDVEYVLSHRDVVLTHATQWELVESSFFKVNRGTWNLSKINDHLTRASYKIEVEFDFFAPGFVVNQLIQSQLPKMLAQFEERALQMASSLPP